MGLIIRHRTKNHSGVRAFILLLSLLLIFNYSQGQELIKVVDLKGSWKFSIGDNTKWSEPGYNDSHWEKIYVPKSWEEQGFHGYDGYAWYRTSTFVPTKSIYGAYYLKLGFIDDVDEVFINGIRIGHTGRFPPNYTTAYNAFRLYRIPQKVMNIDGKVDIAVRIYDDGGEGGIIQGDISIVADLASIIPDFDLQGEWKFKTGRCSGIPEEMDYQNWGEIIVPGTWEDQGYKGYDGLACYVTEFDLDDQLSEERMVLMLGRIDDLDRVYLNGILIGQSGEFRTQTVLDRSDVYQTTRGYYIPDDILKDKGKNVLVVKVLDAGGLGGIWEGPVGLITQDNYIQYWRSKRKSTM